MAAQQRVSRRAGEAGMATPARFERATFPLGGGRSIQLSYGAAVLSATPDCPITRPGIRVVDGCLLDGDRALHERPVTRERAEERILAVGGQLAGLEGDGSLLTGTDDLRVRDHASIVRLDVFVVEAGGGAIIGNALHVSG